MNDTTRLILTVAVATVLLALVVYGLGIVGEDAHRVNDVAKP